MEVKKCSIDPLTYCLAKIHIDINNESDKLRKAYRSSQFPVREQGNQEFCVWRSILSDIIEDFPIKLKKKKTLKTCKTKEGTSLQKHTLAALDSLIAVNPMKQNLISFIQKH